MGIYGHRFYFKEELPKISEVEEKFYEITGLQLRYYATVHLEELMTDAEDILYHIRKKRSETNYVVVNSPSFKCEGFEDVYLGDYMQPDTRSFYLECGIHVKSMYFFLALIKTFHELGGQTFRYRTYPHQEDMDIEKYLEPYHPYHREWKRIKKWDEMSDVERAGFKGKYSDS